jgi:hypothetical protein
VEPNVIDHFNDSAGQAVREVGRESVRSEIGQQTTKALCPPRIIVPGRKNNQRCIAIAHLDAASSARPPRFFDNSPN